MNRAYTIALICLLVGCGHHPAQRTHVALSVAERRADVAVLMQLERDLAVLRSARDATQADPAAFRTAQVDANGETVQSDDAMIAAARVTPPPRLSYPTQFQAAMAQRNGRAFALAQQQYQEKEGAVAYAFERAHGGARLKLQLRLQYVHLDAKSRAATRSQLAALDAAERATVATQRARDKSALALYRITLASDAARALAAMQSDVRAHAARGTLSPAVPIRVSQAIGAEDAAGRDIKRRFADLARRDAASTRELDTEIATLAAECARLRAEII